MGDGKETGACAGVLSGGQFRTGWRDLFWHFEILSAEGVRLDAMRPRAFPFSKEFREFVHSHERIFVIEQNRDAQFRSLMMIEIGTDPSKLISVLNYDGMPITADNICRQIRERIQPSH